MVGNLEGIVSNVCISGEACGTCRESLCPLDLETIIENCPCRTPSFLDAPSLIDQDLAAANCSGVAVLRNTRDLRRSQCRKDVSRCNKRNPAVVTLKKTKLPEPPSESKLNEAIAWVAKLVKAALQTSSFPDKSKSPYALNRRDCESPPYCEAFKLLFEFTARKRNTIIKWTGDNHMSQSNDVFYATSTER